MKVGLFVLIGLVVIAITYVIGLIAFNLLGKKKELPNVVSYFLKMALGITFIIVFISVCHTKGLTVLAGVPVLFALVLWLGKYFREFFWAKPHIEWKHLALSAGLVPLFIFIQLYRTDFFNPAIINCGDVDSGIYTTVSEYLIRTGVEVSSPWYQLFDVAADKLPKPYHYDDLWFLGFTLLFNKSNPIDTFHYVLIPIFAVVLFFGHFALLRSFIPKHKKLAFWLPVFAFLGVTMMAWVPFLEWSYTFHMNTLTYPKVTLFSAMLIASWLFRRYEIKLMDCFVLCASALANILTLPIIYVSCVVFWGMNFYSKREKVYLYKLLILTGVVGFYFAFYHTVGNFQTSCVGTEPPGVEGYLYWVVKIWVAQHVKHLIFFFPSYLALFYFLFANRNRMIVNHPIAFNQNLKCLMEGDSALLVLIFILFEAGCLASALMNNYVEYFQISHNLHTTLSSIFMLWLLAMFFKDYSERKDFLRNVAKCLLIFQFCYGFLVTVFLYQQRDSQYTAQFVNNANKLLDNRNPIGVSINNLAILTTYNADPRMCIFCNFLKKNGSGYWANQITLPEKIEDLTFMERKNAVELSPFYRYIQEQKKEGTYKGFEAAQIDFIETYKVDFVVVEKGARIPPRILSCADTLLMDSYSGVQLIRLKRPCSPNNQD